MGEAATARFRFVTALLLATATFYIAFYLAVFFALGSPRLLYITAVTVGLAGAVAQARRLSSRGQMQRAVLLLGYALAATAAVVAPVFPVLYPFLLLMPLASGALVIGYVEGPPLRRFLGVCGASAVMTAVVGGLAPPETEFSGWVTLTILLGAVVVAVVIFLTLLWQSSSRLHAALADLRQADRFKDEFLSLLGHELRTPLSSVSNASALLLDGSQAPAALPDMIRTEVQHMTRLLDDLLDLSKVKQGKLTLQLRALDLADVVGRVVGSARTRLTPASPSLSFEPCEAPLWVLGDEVRLVQIATNLVENALKYTAPEGTVSVRVGREGGAAVLRVRDTGMGLSPELLAKAFDPFVQGPPLPGRVSFGLGLGLALVKHLAGQHGGEVRARSEGKGRGAEFEFSLPTIEAPARLATEREPSGPARLRCGRVLVVDDNANAATTLALLVTSFGYESRTANDAPAALEAVRTWSPDVAVLDLGLPTMDGATLGVELKAHSTRALTLLAVTGYGQEEHRARTRDAGFDAHFMKPVDHQALAAALDEALQRAAS